MKIHKVDATTLGKFGEDLKQIMIKHDIKSITPLSMDMEIRIEDNEHMTLYFLNSNIKTGIKIEGVNA